MNNIKNSHKYLLKNIAEDLDEKLPIKLIKIEDIINNIHKQYPFIDKAKTSFIIKSAFETIRKLIIEGNIININNFILNMSLTFYVRKYKDKQVINIKSKISTPQKFKNE